MLLNYAHQTSIVSYRVPEVNGMTLLYRWHKTFQLKTPGEQDKAYLLLWQDVWSRSEWQNWTTELITKVLIEVLLVMSTEVQC